MIELNIVTPVYKPANIPAIYHSIEEQAKQLRIVWWPIFDASCKKEGEEWRMRFLRNKNQLLQINTLVSEIDDPSGFLHKNYVLDQLEQDYIAACNAVNMPAPTLGDEWIYLLDDNNILNHELIVYLLSTVHQVQCYDGFFFGAWQRNGSLVYRPLNGCIRVRSLKGVRFEHSHESFRKLWEIKNRWFCATDAIAYERYLT